jgi:hypothetical protein
MGGEGFPTEPVRSLLAMVVGKAKVLPQEAFLDEFLFGYNRWMESSNALRQLVHDHKGMEMAKAAGRAWPCSCRAYPRRARSCR